MSEALTESRRKQLLESYFQSRVESLNEASPAIPSRVSGTDAPLTFAQHQLWLHARLAPNLALYNEPITVRHRGPLNPRILEQAFSEIVRRHEAWRTFFPLQDGEPVQRVLPAFFVELPEIDLRELDREEREEEALRIATADARLPFDLATGPLFRAKLVQLGAEEHRLYVTLHHLIFDGFSGYRVFLPELIALYDAFSGNQPSPLEELPFQFGDYAMWQHQRLEGAELESHLDYWRRQLSAPLPSLQLPVAELALPVQSFSGAMQTVLLPAQLSEAFRELCRNEGVTLFMALLAAFNVLLSRYSGQEDIIIGSNSAGRTEPGSERLLGYFLNTIPLRTDLAGDPSFRELLDRVRRMTLEALSHDEVPLDRLVAELHPERTANRNALFQTLFSLEPPLPPVGSEWDLTCIDVETGATKFEFCMVLDDRSEGLLCRLIYDIARFDAETVKRIAGHWETLLKSIVNHPEARISQLPILTSGERRKLLVEWNDTGLPGEPAMVLDLFHEQTRTRAGAMAVRCGSKELTYAELDRRAARLAHRLKAQGVGANVPVALCMDRSVEMIIAVLAVIKSGGAYVPLDPANPSQRLELILADCLPKVLITQKGSVGETLSCNVQKLLIDEVLAGDVGHPRVEPRQANCGAGDLAYILYTSGSTGAPKGVEITHRNLAYSTRARLRYYKESPERFLLLSSYSFDSSVAVVFHTLCTGGELIIPPPGFRWEGEQLRNLISDQKITHLLAVPSLYGEVLSGADRAALRSLQSVIVAGESCSRQLVNLHYEIAPHASLFNEYGPTEGTVWSTVFECEPGSGEASVPIGHPVGDTRVYILDPNLEPVPVGVPGELFIGGEGVAQAYLNQPALTERHFLKDRFTANAGAKLYRTGDLARYLPNGDIEFLGRSDQQVKIRGQRVELDEVEAMLSRHPAVREAAVLAKSQPAKDDTLVAFLVAQSNGAVSATELREFLRGRLPAYMIPANFVFLDTLPRTANGKIHRQKLAGMELGTEGADEALLPRDEIEQRLLAIWRDVLKASGDDVRQDFFELGGHSLLAAKLLVRIEREFQTALSPAFIFQSPTIEKMALALRSGRETLRVRAIVPIQRNGALPPLFWIRGGPRFRLLAQKLGSKRPFLGVDLPYADGVKLPVPHRLEDIAAYLLKAIREEQPEGPYYLAGLCVNAVIAYEVAQQLVRDGQTVALLAMVDAHNHAYYKNPFKDGRYTARIKYHLANLVRMDANETTTYLRERLEEARRKIERITWRLTADRKDRGDDFKNTDSIIHPAFSQYEPKPYPGKIVLLQSSEWPQSPYFEFRLGWEALVGAMDFRRIQGDHAYLFDEPCVDVLAAVVQEYLRG
jgi:surfactin family lipopeptide synthetase A